MKKAMNTIDRPDRYYNRVIKDFRKKGNRTQKEVAVMLGVSQNVISYIENGSSPMKTNTFIAYCAKLGIDVNEYMNSK